MDSATATARRACRHCGTFFEPTESLTEFCCAGCQFVHRLIGENGWDRFYELKGDRETVPIRSTAFRERDYAWAGEAMVAAEEEAVERDSESPAHLDLDVQGVSCVACVWLIENVFHRAPGSLRVDINAHLGRLRAWWKPGAFDLEAVARELQQFGYTLGPLSEAGERAKDGSRDLVMRIGLCAAFAMNAMGFTLPRYLGMDPDFSLARLFELLSALSATLSLLVGGSYFIRRAWHGMLRRTLHIDLPISLGIIFAYAGSIAGWLVGHEELLYFDFVAIFVFLMLVGRWVQEVAVEKNRNRILNGDALPANVAFYPGDDAAPETRALDQVEPGDVIGVKPGGVVPVGGELFSGKAELSLEWINGEPEASAWKRGGRVPAGAINLGPEKVRVRAAEPYADSLLARLVAPRSEDDVEFASASAPAGLQRILKVYLLVVLGMALAGGVAWLAATGDAARALQVTISVLVVSCPCALGIALPLADELAVSGMRRVGLFVRHAGLWKRLGHLKRVVFDKTGTLTLEVPELTNPEAVENLGSGARAVLAALVGTSLHPFSRSLREKLMSAGIRPAAGIEVRESVGEGVEGVDGEGNVWRLGRDDWSAGSESADPARVDCRFTRSGETLATLHFSESLRPDVIEEVDRLRRRELDVCILSGDREARVRPLGERLGLRDDQCLAGMTPDEKAAWVRAHPGGLYIGDGANDSLAFGESDCSGTPAVDSSVLQRKADFYFLGRGVRAVRKLLEMGDRRTQVVRRVFAFSATYNAAAVALSLAGWMSPLLAAVLMPLSSLASLAIVTGQLSGQNR